MRPECIAAVTKAIGRDLTSKEATDIEARVRSAMRSEARADPSAWQAKTAAEQLELVGEAVAKQLAGEAALKKRRVVLQSAAIDRLGASISDMRTRGISGLDALDRVIAFHADGKSNVISIESQAKAIERDSLRQMLDTLTGSNPKWFGLFENQKGVEDIVRAIFGETNGVAPEAVKGAKEWASGTAALRERFNRAGGDIGALEDWGLPHHHSQSMVAKAGRDQWVTDTLPLLDREHYFNEDGSRMDDAQLTDFLKEAWTSIATGGANKLTPGGPKGSGMRANRGNESRQIHYKDARAYLEYQKSYGERSLYEVLISHIAGVSKDVGLVETFGPNPDNAFRYWRDSLVQEGKLAEPVNAGKFDERAIRTENLYNEVAGKTLPVASARLASTFDTVRNWMVGSRLGSAVITSFSDDATLYLTGHLNNLPAIKLAANELAALNPANRTEERMALRAGLAMNSLISSLNRFGQQGLGSAFSRKLANTVLRVSGLNAMTEARKRAFGVTMLSSLGSVTKEHPRLADLDASDYRILLSKGLTETDWSVWRAAQLEDWSGGNNTMLTPESIYRIPDAKLAELGDPTQLKEQAVTKLLGIVLEEADVAVIEPGATEKIVTGANLQRGTWKGELTRSFFLFKSFPLAMISRHWARGMSLPNTGGRAAYIATLLAATTVAGMVSLQIGEVLKGRDPRTLNPMARGGLRNWMAAMLKGGSLGIYGDFLFSDATQHGQSPFATLSGPVLGTVEDVTNLTQGNIMQAVQGKDTNAGAEMVRFVRGNTPGASLWYAKAALDHLVWNQLAEYYSPGYLAKMRVKAQQDYGQKYWWEPQDVAPDRAPDVGALVH